MMRRMISYAQNFEDVYLRRVFDDLENGFYIDIGSSSPDNLSVTKHFYDLGWNGINVDPLDSAYTSFKNQRTRDINLKVAVSNQSGQRDFYEVQDYTELSTFSLEIANKLESEGKSIRRQKVEVITGSQLVNKYCPERTVDFMKIDVEGAEKEIITSFDFYNFRPRILIVESTIPGAQFPGWMNINEIETHKEWEADILAASYSFALFDGLNRYYVREEDSNFLRYFDIGICHWDNFEQSKSFNRINELQWHCDERMKQIIELTDEIRKRT